MCTETIADAGIPYYIFRIVSVCASTTCAVRVCDRERRRFLLLSYDDGNNGLMTRKSFPIRLYKVLT